jgi:hypothetical protein
VKRRVLVKLARSVRGLPSAAGYLWRRGEARVVSIQCRMCERWLPPDGWDPQAAACDPCVSEMKRQGVTFKPFHGKGFSGYGAECGGV